MIFYVKASFVACEQDNRIIILVIQEFARIMINARKFCNREEVRFMLSARPEKDEIWSFQI